MNTEATDAVAHWQGALRAVTSSRDDLLSWQDRRYAFAYMLGIALCSEAGPGVPAVTGYALYGVYIAGAGLVYVGQTRQAERRLRDLPVGESHHIAATVPAEIWERVVVVQWPKLLPDAPPEERDAAARLGLAACGLAMEHRMQLSRSPVLTSRRRATGGTWRPRRLEASRSKGAASSSMFPELFRTVESAWTLLELEREPRNGGAVGGNESGRVVFPGALLTAAASHSESAAPLVVKRPS